MIGEEHIARALYRRLLSLYPRGFRERLGESMQQSFDDLRSERKRQDGRTYPIFVLWIFVETTLGIIKEHALILKETNPMKNAASNLGSSALIGFLLILPFMIMEVVHRRNFNEGFPITLFIGLWLNLFALSLILVPVVRNIRVGNRGAPRSLPEQGSVFIANAKWAAVISLVLLLTPLLIQWLDSLGGLPLQSLINGPNPEQPSNVPYLPGLLISLGLFFLPPVAAAIIASRPIVSTLRAGGSLFAHPINLIIVFLIVAPMIYGLTSLIVDQWPCFVGVPNCD
jgi:hypothetical protein